MANTVIALKKSGTPAAVPVDLANGELAINYADGKLYYKANNGTIQSISGNEPNYFGTVNANNSLIVADTPGDILTIEAGSNIILNSDPINDKITISALGGGSTITTSDTAPPSPTDGDMWWNSSIGKMFVYYDDVDTAQWVEAVPNYIYTTSDTVAIPAIIAANLAYLQANAAYDQANTAYAQANNAGFSFTQANAAYTQANVAPIAFTHANNAYNKANVSGTTANLAFTHANSAYAQANIVSVAFDVANVASIAFTHANNAYFQANVATANATNAFGQANTARTHANNAYAVANVAPIAFTHANAAFGQANAGISTANLAFTHANVAFGKANTANITADLAFNKANSANITADLAFNKANSANITADLAFNKANSANVLAFEIGEALTTANGIITAAFAKANTGGGGGVNTFIQLTDVPSSYTNSAGYLVTVNPGGTGLQFSQDISLDELIHTARVAPTTVANDSVTVYVTATGTTPNREVAYKIKNESGEEIIISSILV